MLLYATAHLGTKYISSCCTITAFNRLLDIIVFNRLVSGDNGDSSSIVGTNQLSYFNTAIPRINVFDAR